MISLPILLREFRVTARQPRTFVIRAVFGGLLALVALLFITMALMAHSNAIGVYMLKTFAWQILFALFVLAPALSCGCISEERRYGTLGLLFLTHLNSADIILGKFVSRGLDLLLLFLSALPFLFVPILMGGVGWQETMTVAWNIVSLLVLSLSFGVFCSTFCRTTMQAVIVAYITLIVYNAALFVVPLIASFAGVLGKSSWVAWYPEWLKFASPVASLWYGGARNALISLACSTCLGVGFLGLAMWRLPRTIKADAEGSPARARWWQWRFVGAKGRRSRGRRLGDSNPILWLHFMRRSRWMFQLVLIAVLGMAMAYLYATTTGEVGRMIMSMSMGWVGWLLALCIRILIIVLVARSFVTEKEDGSLELLLITPLRNSQVVHGKLLSVLARYGLLYAAACILQFPIRGGYPGQSAVLLHATQLVTDVSGLAYLLCVGMLVSVWARSALQAVLYTIAATMVVSWLLSIAAALFMLMLRAWLGLLSGGGPQTFAYFGVITIGPTVLRLIVDLTLAALAYRLLIVNLRKYATRQ